MIQSQDNDENANLPSVFLSYSSEDKVFVRKLADRLIESKVKVWLDELKLNIGDSLTRSIGPAINNYDFFAIVLSKHSVASEWVQRELENAINREIDEKRVFVLPILLEKIELPPFLNGKKYGDFTTEEIFEDTFQKLLRVFFKDTMISDKQSDKFFPTNFIPDLKFFVGREELLENLKKKLDEKHRASIHDISGLGKTFTTYKFADLYQNNYEKIFFVRVSKEEMLKNLAEIGVLLNPYLKDEPDQSKQAKGFKDWLEKNENWLVIYDNVDIPADLFPFVPLNKKGDCLFTSNFSRIKNLGEEVTIKKLNKANAEKLLFSRSSNIPGKEIEFSDEKEQEAFEKIIEEIDGLPVSLNTTGAFISENEISFAEFYGKLNRTPEILLKNEDDFDIYQNKSALKAFSIALDDISEKKDEDEFENSAELAQKLLFAVSFIAPDNIPEILLQKTLQNIAEIDFEAEENRDLWQEIRRKSLAYDLLKYDKSSKLFNTHRLIQKVIQTRQKDEEQKEVIQKTISAIDELFEYSKHETKENCELYTPHAVVLVEKAEKTDLLSEEIAQIYFKIGRHLRETVKYQNSIAYIQKAIDLYTILSEKEHSNLANCINELGLVYDSQGRYIEAIGKFEEALQIGEKTVSREHPNYAAYLNNLASVYHSQGRYDEAIEKLEEALQIGEKTIGKEHPEYVNRLNNLASIYDSQGRYDEAIEKFEEILQIDEKTIGKEHLFYAIHLDNVGKVYRKKRMFQKAIDSHKEAQVVTEKTVGKKHPSYATRLNNLALVYDSQGKYNKAIKLYKEVIEIYEEIFTKNHPWTATAYNNLAMIYSSQAKYTEAISLYQEAVRIFVRFLGENHPTTQAVKRNLEYCRGLAGKE